MTNNFNEPKGLSEGPGLRIIRPDKETLIRELIFRSNYLSNAYLYFDQIEIDGDTKNISICMDSHSNLTRIIVSLGDYHNPTTTFEILLGDELSLPIPMITRTSGDELSALVIEQYLISLATQYWEEELNVVEN